MKKMLKIFVCFLFVITASMGTMKNESMTYASEDVHSVTFDYNASRILPYVPATSAIRNSIQNYVVTVKDYDYAKETRKPDRTINPFYSYEWTIDGVVVDLDNYHITKDTTFVAKWTPKEYTVYLRFGSNEVASQILNKEDSLKYTVESGRIDLYIPERPHYVFEGWYDGSSPVEYMYIASRSVGDMNLYARFSAKEYYINYNTDADNQYNNTSYSVEDNDFYLRNPSKKGHIFKGWFLDKEYKTEITIVDCSNCGNLNIYPKWDLEKYNVTYILPDGKEQVVEVQYGKTAEMPEVKKSIFEVVTTDISRDNITAHTTIRIKYVNIWYVYVIAFIVLSGGIALIIFVRQKHKNTHNKLRVMYSSNVNRNRRKWN